MRIAIYSHSIAPSIDGVCRRFTGIVHEMIRRGHEVMVFTLEEHPEDLPDEAITISLDYMIFPSYPDKKVAQPTCRTLYKIWQNIRAFRPQVIHVVADGFSHMFCLVGLHLGIPVVGSFHTDIIDLLNNHGAYAFQKLCVLCKEWVDSRVLASCATTSTSFATKLLQQGVKCEHIIITAVDPVTFSPLKMNSSLRDELTFGDGSMGFLCVYVGRISTEKRLEVMIRAIQELDCAGGRRAYLAIVGDGPTAGLYTKMHGKESALYCKPRFLGHSELAEVYASSDLHVSASEFETLGNTVLEAFACGVPVVVPHTQGFRDTVRHEEDGFLFRPSDSQDARRYIQRLKDNPELRREMGARGRKSVASRTISYVVSDLLEWYAKGEARNKRRGFAHRALAFCALWASVPLGIFLLNCYDLVVNLLLKPFHAGGYFGKKRL